MFQTGGTEYAKALSREQQNREGSRSQGEWRNSRR